jgi:hypothetical protein
MAAAGGGHQRSVGPASSPPRFVYPAGEDEHSVKVLLLMLEVGGSTH